MPEENMPEENMIEQKPTHIRKDALLTPICDRLGIQHPVFGFSHSMEVTAAITNAGGFGVYGATRDMPDEITKRLAQIRSMVGDRPFGTDLLLPLGMADKNDWAAAEAKIPDEHKAFVNYLKDKYKVPDPTGKSFFSSVVRSNEFFEAQADAVLALQITQYKAAAVQKQQYGVAYIMSANLNPLLQAV